MKMRLAIFALAALAVVGVDAKTPRPTTNPSFAVTRVQAEREFAVAARTPRRLERPLVIVGGFLDLGVGPLLYEHRLSRVLGGPMLRCAVADCTSFNQCRQRLVARIDERFGVVNDRETVEVDVVGISMGGLVSVYSAIDDPALGKRLKIGRLFTLSAPLQGAHRAADMPFDFMPLIRDMRPGSAFYQRLAKAPIDYTVYSYTLLDDPVVGERYASLPGRGVWWLRAAPGEPAHDSIIWDSRVLLDVARRLRGEPPVASEPPAGLP